MRQSAADILRRWMDLDLRLAGQRGSDGVRLSEFARKWKVDVKTVRRDLAAFKRLGYEAELVVDEPDPWNPGANYLWRYPRGRRPMFTASLPRG